MADHVLISRVEELVHSHCVAKGYTGGPNWNPLVPHDPVAALAMARLLVSSSNFDLFIAVAPEGHVYGYFFEQFGETVHSVFVDYPPRVVTRVDTLPELEDQRVLLIEDDVVSGTSMRLIVEELTARRPRSVSVYLGRRADGQCPENVPDNIESVYLSETHLQQQDRRQHLDEFVEHFGAMHRPP